MRLLAWLKELSTISPLPAWYLTGAVGVIWLSAAFGLGTASDFWRENAATVLAGWLGAIGLWLGSKKIPNKAAKADPTTGQG